MNFESEWKEIECLSFKSNIKVSAHVRQFVYTEQHIENDDLTLFARKLTRGKTSVWYKFKRR